jgi:hypothetical protein
MDMIQIAMCKRQLKGYDLNCNVQEAIESL